MSVAAAGLKTDFVRRVEEALAAVSPQKPEEQVLHLYQLVVARFFERFPDRQRLLVWHEMGLGKSILAAFLGIFFGVRDGLAPIIIAGKSLQTNFDGAIKKVLRMTRAQLGADASADAGDSEIAARFRYVTLNASNMAAQLSKSAATDLDARLGELADEPSLEGKFVIVDEAHNLFRAITNGSANATAVYRMIRKTRRMRLLFLTGTPLVTDPFEMAPLFNMLSPLGCPALPENYETFARYFVDGDQVRNRAKLQNRLFGMVSRVSRDVLSKEILREFPRVLPAEVVRVPMERAQYAAYLNARAREQEEERGRRGRRGEPPALQKPRSGSASTYRVKSRQLGNWHTGVGSPKTVAMMQILRDHPGVAVVYSEFLRMGGHGVIRSALEAAGFREWAPGAPLKKGKHYAVVTGMVSKDDRQRVVDAVSRKENARGEEIRVLLLSKSGIEGLDIKNGRVVIRFEEVWRESTGAQLESRIVRYRSLAHLPAKDRTVKFFTLLAVPPAGVTPGEEETTDEYMHRRAVETQRLIGRLLEAVAEVAIDCRGAACRRCQPTGVPLFDCDVNRDMMLGDPCRPYTTEKVKAKKVVLDDTEYFVAGPDVYTFRTDLGAYQKVPRYTDVYHRLAVKK